MARKAKAILVWKRDIVGLLLLVILVVASCGQVTPEAGPIGPSRLQKVSVTPVPLAPYVWTQFCDDITTSYPRDDFNQAELHLAQWIDELVRPAVAGATIYVGYIDHDSYAPESTVMTITVPAIVPEPVTPTFLPLSSPTGTINPFAGATATAEAKQITSAATALVKEELDIYQTARAAYDRHLVAVRKEVKKQTDALRGLNPQPDDIGTDVWGCIQRASERFSTVHGKKVLLLASDMEMNGPQEKDISYDLSGVSVYVIYYYCEHVCIDKTAYWRNVLKPTHLINLRFLEPAESQVQSNLLLN